METIVSSSKSMKKRKGSRGDLKFDFSWEIGFFSYFMEYYMMLIGTDGNLSSYKVSWIFITDVVVMFFLSEHYSFLRRRPSLFFYWWNPFIILYRARVQIRTIFLF